MTFDEFKAEVLKRADGTPPHRYGEFLAILAEYTKDDAQMASPDEERESPVQKTRRDD